jgi:DNA repair protein RadC
MIDLTRTSSNRRRFCQLKAVRVFDCAPIPATTPQELVTIWHDHIAKTDWFDPDKEALVAVMVNTRLRSFAFNLVSLGTINETVAHPREVLRPAILSASYGLVMMHNHPAGDPQPSAADRSFTRRMREACEILQIKLFDHVIVGAPEVAPGYFSFREMGLL